MDIELAAGWARTYSSRMRIFAIFALGLLVGLVVGYFAGRSSGGPSRRIEPDHKNPWS